MHDQRKDSIAVTLPFCLFLECIVSSVRLIINGSEPFVEFVDQFNPVTSYDQMVIADRFSQEIVKSFLIKMNLDLCTA